VGEVEVQGGILAIKQQGKGLNGLYVSIREIPNLCIPEELINSICEGDPS
jgi:hypothetical protein